jgi:CrcB protein
MLMNCFFVAVGGSIGALARYGVSLLAHRLFGAGFPVGTLFVNLTGCFLIGVSFSLVEQKVFSSNMRLFFITGFLGGLTTFSAFAVETVIAGRDGLHWIALANLTANNVAGLALVLVGLWLGRLI